MCAYIYIYIYIYMYMYMYIYIYNEWGRTWASRTIGESSAPVSVAIYREIYKCIDLYI